MAAAEIARKVMRDVRNRWSYEEVENFVRDATSNTNEPPGPRQIRQIADAMLYYESYPKAFAMLWRRLTHLEYKRHVAKALLVLDSLVRIRPPSKAVQLRLMVDIRERWPEIYRLAKLRPSSSSETIAQIQRVAERLCAFIMGYQVGYINDAEEEEEKDADEEDSAAQRRAGKLRRRRKKRTTTVEEEEQQPQDDADGDEDAEESPEDDHAEGDDGAERAAPAQPATAAGADQLPPVSPFGFDFFQHTNFEWTAPPPAASTAAKAAVPPSAAAAPSGWACKACTYHNADSQDKCEICGGERFMEMEEEEKKADEPQGWQCQACSFINKEDAEQCEVCETQRGRGAPAPKETGEGGAGYPREGEVHGSGERGESNEEDEQKEWPRGDGSQLPGAWACSYCSWLNPPAASHCEVCEREGKKSGMAQLVKLEMARRYDRADHAEGEGGEGGSSPAAPGKQPWSCSVCTMVNPSTRVECAACGAQSPYATELLLTGGAGSSYTSASPSPEQSRRGSYKDSILSASSQPHANVRGPFVSPAPVHPHSHAQAHQALGEPSMDTLAVPETVPGAHLHNRHVGFAAGYADSNSRRLSGEAEVKGEEDDGAELLDAVKSQQSEMVHQMAALQHYNQQRELYRQQHGWSCATCSFLNDPQAVRCEMCETPRPALSASQQLTQAQVVAQQPRMAQASPPIPIAALVPQASRPSLPSSGPAPSPVIQRAPSIPSSSPVAARTSPPTQQRAAAQPSLPQSKPTAPATAAAPPANPRIPASVPIMSSSIRAPSMPVSSPIVSQLAASSARVLSPAMPPPDVIPQAKAAEWACDVCTLLNAPNDPKCIMCGAPRPLTVSVANREAAGRTPMPTGPVPAIPTSPPVPASVPAVANPRRATQPLPASRPVAAAPIQKRLSVLEGVPGSDQRGPAPVPGGEGQRFPAQFQQLAVQAAQAQEFAQQQARLQQAQAAQQRAMAQQMVEATAAQQLQSLPPLFSMSPPPSQQRVLQQHEQWLAQQHALKQRELQQQQERQQLQQQEQVGKGGLDSLINDYFTPRGQDKPIDLVHQLQAVRQQSLPQAPHTPSVSPYPTAGVPGPQAPKPTHKHGASADFYNLFDQSAAGFGQDLVGRRSPALGEGSAPAQHANAQRPPQQGAPQPLKPPSIATSQPIFAQRFPAQPQPPQPLPPPPSPIPGFDESPPPNRSESPLPLQPTPQLVQAAASVEQPKAVAPSSAPEVRHQKADSWDQQAAAAAAQGRVITPFDTPLPAGESVFAWPRVQQGEKEDRVAAVPQRGEGEGEAHPGEREGVKHREGEGEGEGSAIWSQPPPTKVQAAVAAQSKPALSLSIPPAPVAPAPVPISREVSPEPVVAKEPPPRRPISAEARGPISALAAALAASAAQQATAKATQSPAAEAAALLEGPPAVTILPPPVVPVVITPIPVKPKPAATVPPPIALPRGDSASSIGRPSEEPSTPVSSNRPSTTRKHSPSSKEHQADMRVHVREEIVSTEKFYVECLNDLVRQYMEPIKKLGPKMGVEPRHVSAMFGNLTVLVQFHSIFLESLRSNPNTSAVFVQFADFLKMYTQYVGGYEKSIATINSLRGNKAFQKLLEDKRDELKGRGIMTYLIMPVQRIPRYVLLLRELKKHTGEDHPEHEALCVALAKIEKIAEHVNERQREQERMSKLLDIQNRLRKSDFILFKPDRRLIKEGMIRRLKEEYVLERSREEPYSSDVEEQLFFLFNDLLLWTTKEFDIVGHTPLERLLCLPDNAQFRVPFTLSLGIRGRPFCPDMLFACKDQTEKDEWTRYILSAINTATDPSKQRKAGASTSLGSIGKQGTVTSIMVPTSASSHLDENDDPPSRNASSVSSASSSSSNSSSGRGPSEARLPPPSAATAAAEKREPAVASRTTPLPSVPVYEPLPASAAPAAANGGSESGPPRAGLSSSALLQQVLQSRGTAPSPAATSFSTPPPLLSQHSGMPPPSLSSFQLTNAPVKQQAPYAQGPAPLSLMSGGKAPQDEKER